mmetsp:Transcript_20724/g.49271  ORF Transcript_20724/g.49271 Transcript_20724/m.49271 type:complete len:200 (+) Transcript_20724:1020-1619(+)
MDAQQGQLNHPEVGLAHRPTALEHLVHLDPRRLPVGLHRVRQVDVRRPLGRARQAHHARHPRLRRLVVVLDEPLAGVHAHGGRPLKPLTVGPGVLADPADDRQVVREDAVPHLRAGDLADARSTHALEAEQSRLARREELRRGLRWDGGQDLARQRASARCHGQRLARVQLLDPLERSRHLRVLHQEVALLRVVAPRVL